jgi:hypothetical protein
MRIVVNHLTRMQAGYFCVAGTDLGSGRCVRPVMTGRLTTQLLARNGGPFDVGNVVDLGSVRNIGVAPEVEDYRFFPARATVIGVMPDADFWARLGSSARPTFRAVFGPVLQPIGQRSFAVNQGQGTASLGFVKPTIPPDLQIRSRPNKPPQVRLRVRDGDIDADVPLTDIRFYGADHVTPDQQVFTAVARRIRGGVPVILAVGLTRPFAGQPNQPPVHWLQVNNVHLEDQPVWPLG